MLKNHVNKSVELNDLLDSIYDLYVEHNSQISFRRDVHKWCDLFFENEYVGASNMIDAGIHLFELSKKIKKPIYLVICSRTNNVLFFVGRFSQIKKKLINEKIKFINSSSLKVFLKKVNSLDASILAYVALSSDKKKKKEILPFLSKKVLSLGECIAGHNGNYSLKTLKIASLYKEWAHYTNIDTKNPSDPSAD